MVFLSIWYLLTWAASLSNTSVSTEGKLGSIGFPTVSCWVSTMFFYCTTILHVIDRLLLYTCHKALILHLLSTSINVAMHHPDQQILRYTIGKLYLHFDWCSVVIPDNPPSRYHELVPKMTFTHKFSENRCKFHFKKLNESYFIIIFLSM